MNKIKELIFNITENNNTDSIFENQDKILKNIQDFFKNEFDTSFLDEGKDIIIPMDKVSITLTTTKKQKNNENKIETTINFVECEDKLREKYNISQNDSLYILKLDTLMDNIQKVEYEVYYPFSLNNLTMLDLSICKNITIDISIPIEIPINEIDKYNASSDFYNDICYTLTTDSGTDKSLKDRRDEYKSNNFSVCEESCYFSKYDNKAKRATCSCFTKIKFPMISEIKVDKAKLFSNFKNIKNIGNFKMLECKHLLFDKKNIFKNSANYMMILLFIISLISLFRFLCYNNKNIKKFIINFGKEGERETKNENNSNTQDKNLINMNKNYKKLKKRKS